VFERTSLKMTQNFKVRIMFFESAVL
jgi:hypothetical protein